MDLNEYLINLLNQSIFGDEAFKAIDAGANPNVLNDSGYSLLHLLIFNKKFEKAFE